MLAESRRYRRARVDQREDSLRQSRAEAYREFVREAHLAAHLIGRTAVGCDAPLDRSPEVLARVDSEVARRLYELEIFAGAEVLAAARSVRSRLVEFRIEVQQDVPYMSDAYRRALRAYQDARKELLSAARTEMLGG
jgi:hypothetical protein